MSTTTDALPGRRARPRAVAPTSHEWALVITAVVTLAAIAALALIALGKGWL